MQANNVSINKRTWLLAHGRCSHPRLLRVPKWDPVEMPRCMDGDSPRRERSPSSHRSTASSGQALHGSLLRPCHRKELCLHPPVHFLITKPHRRHPSYSEGNDVALPWKPPRDYSLRTKIYVAGVAEL